jgi:hypothetical protein
MPRYSRDPRWITTRYPSTDTDGNPVPVGTRAFYYPTGKQLLTGEKAEKASREFEAACADEAVCRQEYERCFG